MMFNNIGYHFLLPFRNLTAQARFLQIIRLFTCIATLTFIIATLIGSLANRNIYIARINCARLDVARGLYNSLRSSVSLSSSILGDSEDNVLPVDSSLTNSEITVLTSYAENQVADAPQYIVTSLWSWCYGNYNITQHTDRHGVVHIAKHNDVLTCSKSTKRYIFDYKEELELIGLQSILAYAYQSSDLNDKKYEETIAKRNNKYKLVPSGLMFGASSQLVVLIFGYVLYSNRGPEQNLNKIPVFVMNIIALISVASFLSLAVSSSLMTNLLIEIRGEIKSNLGDYGIALHFGDIWFLLLWLSFTFSLLSSVSWTFPLWCANPRDFDEEEDFDDIRYGSDNITDNEEAGMSDLNGLRRNQSVSDQYNRFNKTGANISSGVQYKASADIGAKNDNDVEERDFSDDEDHEYETDYVYNDTTNRKYDAYGARNEDELRKLGETLSRKMSVRRLNRNLSKKSRKSYLRDAKYPKFEDESSNLLYHDVNISSSQYPMTESMAHHYREETFDGYVNSHKPTTSASTMSLGTSKNLTSHINKIREEGNNTPTRNPSDKTVDRRKNNKEHDTNFRSNSLQERHFQHNTRNNPFLQSDTLESLENKRNSTGDSFLNFDEMEILDNNNYINRL